MKSAKTSNTKLGKRGIVNIPPYLLDTASIDPCNAVWMISDGDLLIIKNVFQKRRSTYPPLIQHIRGAFKRLISG